MLSAIAMRVTSEIKQFGGLDFGGSFGLNRAIILFYVC